MHLFGHSFDHDYYFELPRNVSIGVMHKSGNSAQPRTLVARYAARSDQRCFSQPAGRHELSLTS